MDILLSFFFLLIATIIGVSLCLFLGMKSYIKIAIVVILLFIPMELYNDYFNSNKHKIPKPNSKPIINTISNTISNSINNNSQEKTTTVPITTKVNSTEAQSKDSIDTETTKYSEINTNEFEMNKPPFDGLKPQELLNRLNYIHYATANPKKPINYNDYKTHADKLINHDKTKLSTNDKKLLPYLKAYYPQLTENHIDARDCLNEGSNKNSCFQNPSLFFNAQNDFNILKEGVTEDNANLLIREDFSMPMIIDKDERHEPVLFQNTINGNLDKLIDSESNETIDLTSSNNACRHCKLALCKNDYCGLQNKLFM